MANEIPKSRDTLLGVPEPADPQDILTRKTLVVLDTECEHGYGRNTHHYWCGRRSSGMQISLWMTFRVSHEGETNTMHLEVWYRQLKVEVQRAFAWSALPEAYRSLVNQVARAMHDAGERKVLDVQSEMREFEALAELQGVPAKEVPDAPGES